METWRKLLLLLLAAGALLGIWLSWGSIGSVILTFALGVGICALLIQKFLINNEDNDFWEDQNG